MSTAAAPPPEGERGAAGSRPKRPVRSSETRSAQARAQRYPGDDVANMLNARELNQIAGPAGPGPVAHPYGPPPGYPHPPMYGYGPPPVFYAPPPGYPLYPPPPPMIAAVLSRGAPVPRIGARRGGALHAEYAGIVCGMTVSAGGLDRAEWLTNRYRIAGASK